MRDYIFDVHIDVKARVKANTEKGAREALNAVLKKIEPEAAHLKAVKAVMGCTVKIDLDANEATLVDEDGKQLASIYNCRHSETGGGFCLDCGYDTCKDED